MFYVRNVNGKKAVYWQWEPVSVYNLIEAIKKEFPDMFPYHLAKLELIAGSMGILAVVRKGDFNSVADFVPPMAETLID